MSGLRSFQDSWLQHPVEALILVLALPPSSQEAVNRDEVWIGRRVARIGRPGIVAGLTAAKGHHRRPSCRIEQVIDRGRLRRLDGRRR